MKEEDGNKKTSATDSQRYVVGGHLDAEPDGDMDDGSAVPPDAPVHHELQREEG